jgi:hypothetical protein
MNRNSKKYFLGVISLLIAICMTFSSHAAAFAAETPSSDVNDSKATQTLNEWLKKDHLEGYPDGTFRPPVSITRAEAVVSTDHALKSSVRMHNRKFDKAGTYGPASGMETITGNVKITVPGVIVQNMIIKGDLTFGEGIRSGDVTINHVTVEGKTYVNGGGENSIHFIDSVIVMIEVGKKSKSGIVRIVAEGSTSVQSVILKSSAKVEENDTTGVGFLAVELSRVLPKNSEVTLTGNFSTVDVNGNSIKISIPKGTVDYLNVGDKASKSLVDLGDDARIVTLILHNVTQIWGGGKIETAIIHDGAGGSSFENKPDTLEGSQKDNVILPPPIPLTTLEVSSVNVTPASMILTAGGATGTLAAAVIPADATNKTVTWSSSNTTVATVSSSGIVTPIKAGTATITVTTIDGNFTATSDITIPAVYESNESYSIDHVLKADSNYNVLVQSDPQDPNNKVAMTTFSGVSPSGNLKTYYPAVLPGKMVLKEKIQFAGNAAGIFYQMFIGNNGNVKFTAPLWKLQMPSALYLGTSTVSENFAGNVRVGEWYTITAIINTSTAQYDIYMEDKGGYLLFKGLDRSLPVNGTNGLPVNYTNGINQLFDRYIGTTSTSASAYTDDWQWYAITDEMFASMKVEEAEKSKSQSDLEVATTVVSTLPAGANRTALEARLDIVNSELWQAPYVDAEQKTARAERNVLKVDYDLAKTAVDALVASDWKDALEARLEVLNLPVLFAEADTKVTHAEQTLATADYETAAESVTVLPNSEDKVTLTERLNAIVMSVETVYFDETLDDKNPGDTVYAGGNYNVVAAVDPDDLDDQGNPDNPQNIVAYKSFNATNTSGFMDKNFSSAIKGHLVLEQKIRFEGGGTGITYSALLRSMSTNGAFTLWQMSKGGLQTSNKTLTQKQIHNDTWYKIICVIDTEGGTYDMYIVDLTNSEFLEQSLGLNLPAKDTVGNSIDYSQGFKTLHRRIVGTVSSGDAAALYSDDWSIKAKPLARINAELAEEIGDIVADTHYYSTDLVNRLAHAVVLYEGGYYGYVNNTRSAIDSEHLLVRPELVGSVAMAPVAYVAAGLGADAVWNAANKEMTITRNGTTVGIAAGQTQMTVNGTPVVLVQQAVMGEDGLEGPVGDLAEAFGLHLYQDDTRKVWIVSDSAAIFDPLTEFALLDELADARYGIRKPTTTIAQTASAPDGVATQAASFAARNSAASLEQLAKNLDAALVGDVPGLATFRLLVANGHYTEALDEFRSYFLNKLSVLEDFDWARAVESKALSSTANVGEELLFNTITTPAGVKTQIGKPGTINWDYKAPTDAYDSTTTSLNTFMWHPVQFGQLISRYMTTGNPSYLEKWSDYIDDWALHSTGFNEILPQQLSDLDFNPAGVVNSMISSLNNIGRTSGNEALPAPTMIRFLLRIVEQYPPLTVEYMRSNPQNWSTQLFTSLIVNGLLLDEFKDAALYTRQGIRRMEDMATTHMLPDGTDSEQSISYNREYLRFGAGAIYPFLKDRPDLLPADKESELLGHLWDRSKLMTDTLMANGKYPGGFRIDMRDWSSTVRSLLRDALPEALNDPNISAILAIAGGDKNSPAPSYTSEWFPYGGYSFIRQGWQRQDQAAFLFSSSHPGNYGFHSLTGNNMLWLSASGQDMLVPGEIGAYDNIPTPVLVDGMEQNGDYGIPTWGHRQYLVSAWDEPEDLRWGESDHFNLTEGLYARHYGDSTGTDDVAHGRVLQFLRDAGLWIVTDRMTANTGSHNYTVNWRLPSLALGPRGNNGYKAFTPGNIQIDTQSREATLQTEDANIANLSIYQFGTSVLQSTGVVDKVDAGNTYKISDYYRFGTTFGGTGEQALVSLIVPRQTISDDIASIESLNGNGTAGFAAVLKDGRTVKHLVAANKNEPLTIDGVAVQGESLLFVTEVSGLVRGIALGVNSMSINGITQSPGMSDCEFTIDASGNFQVADLIYKPIANVQITPKANVFADNVDVSMTDATVGVDIRYTTDGSEPTLTSTKYTAPFNLTESAVVKARAFRSNITSIPDTVTGTLASATRLAVFTKQPLQDAATVSASESGLHYRYYEGDWKDMIYRMDRMTPIQEGDANGLFDFAAKQTNDPYGFEYSGYLDVPTDGIYTFYAPQEWLRPEIMAGYDLQVFVDGDMWYPITRRQAFGSWSVALKQGPHTFEVRYIDYRGDAYSLYNTGAQPRIWNGTTPQLDISGPGLMRQSIPAGMLIREP